MEKETLKKSVEMNENIAWELAKKRFEEIEGYVPDINNRTHELMVASLQEGILAGASWQVERMYSEEEVKNLIWESRKLFSNPDYLKIVNRNKKFKFLKWFEQFKKK